MRAMVVAVGCVIALAGCNGGASGQSSPGSSMAVAGVSSVNGSTSQPGSTASGGITKSFGSATGTGTGAGTGTGTSAAPTPGSWAAGPSMSAARAYAAATVTDQGQIYVMGGVDSATGTPLTLNEMYDPVTNTLTEKAPMPLARWQHGIAFLAGKIYVAGGSSATAFNQLFGQPDPVEVDAYDPASDTWATVPPPAFGPARHQMGLLADGSSLWALSGLMNTSSGGIGYFDSNQLDVTAAGPQGGWFSAPALASPISDTSALAAGKAFVAYPSMASLSATLYVANSITAPAFTAAPGSFAVGTDARAVGMNGRVYFLGGIDPGTQASVTTVQSLDATAAIPSTILYQHAGLTTSRARFAAAAWNGKIYVFGGDEVTAVATTFGSVPQATGLSSVEIYTP